MSAQLQVICWGTGEPTREFIYVEDVAKIIVESLKYYDEVDSPLNLSTGQFLKIKDLAESISNIIDYKGDIKWDTSKPDGQMQKILNTGKMRNIFPNFVPTSIEIGIENTIEWYKSELTGKKESR